MNATRIRQFVLVVSAMLVTVANSPVVGAERPNVVVIMTDNHGAWTLGCYGNDEIRSPNIDRLAREGTLFTRAFACNPVCSPTRASFLTGLMPSQHGVHCFLSANRLQLGPQARSTMAEFQTLPEILKAAGYSCGLVGKWHLGDNLRPQEGFDDYWITMPHGGTSTFYDAAIIENGKVRKEPEYLTDFWTRHAVNFIDAHAAKEQPFFLFLSYNGPYALSRLLLKEGKNRHAEYYRDKPLESFPREPAHPWQYNNLDFHNNPTSIRRVATEVSGVDDGVGRVLDSLQRHGVDDKTIVLFLADQGWVGGHGGFFGMGDHTRPVTARDGMMRIPMIWRFPSKIAAGRRTDAMAANYDCLPTLLAQLGLSDQAPAARLPGRDLSADLDARTTSNAASTDRPIFYEFEELRCVRTGKWKYVHRHPNGPHELYNLTDDPDERVNLVGIAGQQATRRRLKLQLDEFFGKHRNAKYDLWSGGGSQTRLFVGIDEELAQEPPAPPPPLAAGFTPVRLRTPEGFVAELAAGPPLVAHPTMACLDDRGRLFVAENAGVNMSAQELEKELPNSVRMLEDTDGDGRYDRSTVFADRMTFPMGGVWKDGALFVASPPNIWRLEDTDGDRVADKREVIVDKFGYTGNAASVHGCFAGPDGRIYWCDGRHGHEFRDEQGKITSKLAGSYIFSCLPDGSDVRIHCGGGMDNPVEIDFTDEGDVIGTVNIMYTRPRVDCLVHWQHGGAYPHSERVLGEFRHTGGLLGPIHRFGHVAISGVTRYRSGVLDHQFQNNMFAAMFNSGRVVRLALQRSGSTYAVTEREFVSSANRDFHPTDVLEDADGSLLIVDTGGWFYRGCPTSQLSKPDVLGGIYRVRRRGMTAQIDPLGKQIAWDALSQGRLIALLNDTRHEVRARAIEACGRQGVAFTSVLMTALRRRDVRHRLGAVWALSQMAGRQPRDLSAKSPEFSAIRAALTPALADFNPSVKQAACRVMATYPRTADRGRLEAVLKTGEPQVRREAAKALGRYGDVRSVPVILAALEGAVDRAEEHALIYAAIEIGDIAALQVGLTNRAPAVRRGALIAVDQIDGRQLKPADVARAIRSEDVRLRQTALGILVKHPEWSELAARAIQNWLAAGDSTSHPDAAQLIVAFIADDSVRGEVGRQLSVGGAAETTVLDALAKVSNAAPHASWSQPLSAALRSESTDRLRVAVAAVARMKTKQFDDDLRRIAGDGARPGLLRVAALRAIARSGRPTDDAFQLTVGLLATGDAREAAEAAQLLGGAALSNDQLVELASRLPTAGPLQLRDLLRAYGRSRDAGVTAAFLHNLEQTPAFLSLPTHEFSDVIKRYPDKARERANRLLEKLKAQDDERLAKLDRLLPLLQTGDPVRGEQIFHQEKSKCAVCHRVGERGGRSGPELSTIGRNRSPRDLLESIVFPSSSLVRGYEPYSVQTGDGRVLAGVITRETDTEIVLQQQVGDPLTLRRDDIEVLQQSTVSIMPRGLDMALTEQQLADVIAWLMTKQ